MTHNPDTSPTKTPSDSSLDFFPSDYTSSFVEELKENHVTTAPSYFMPGHQYESSPIPSLGTVANLLTGSFPGEPSLWEELGFDMNLIKTKASIVLNPRKKIENEKILHDTDLGGPFICCLLLGFCLLLGGKVHFGYIFGYSVLGSYAISVLMNLMISSEQTIGISHTMSVLGYGLLPMNILALSSLSFSANGFILPIIAVIVVLWSTYSASSLFVRVLSLSEQQGLIAYPVGLLYACFALMAIF